jgi:DNA-binding LytR/AlgR family response regulator
LVISSVFCRPAMTEDFFIYLWTMVIRCLAIDDEPLALKQIGAYIKKTPFLEPVALCRNAFEAMEFLRDRSADLIFVDISMPDLSGMDFVKSLTVKPYIVFTTAFSEYAFEGFRVEATDYLLKPIGYTDFLKASNKVRSLIELKISKTESPRPSADHIFIKSDYKLIRVELSDIKYIESMHEYVRIHLSNDKPLMTLVSLKSIENQLPPEKFIRVHRSFIVNKDKIKVIERNRIVFDNNIYIPVSDQYKEKFQEFLNSNYLP